MFSRLAIGRDRVGHATCSQGSVYTVTNISKYIHEQNEETYISVVTLSCVERDRAVDATEVVLAGMITALTSLLA